MADRRAAIGPAHNAAMHAPIVTVGVRASERDPPRRRGPGPPAKDELSRQKASSAPLKGKPSRKPRPPVEMSLGNYRVWVEFWCRLSFYDCVDGLDR
jgi:hypothetical protein